MKILITLLFLICLNVLAFGKSKSLEHEYLDTVVNNYINQLKKRSVKDYFVFTETKKDYLIDIGNNEGDRICYIFWKENDLNYIKRFSDYFDKDFICIEYDSLIVKADTVFNLIDIQRKNIINQGNTDKEYVEGLYNKNIFNGDLTILEVFAVLKDYSLYFYDCSWPNPNKNYAHVEVIISIKKIISEYTPEFKIKTKLKPDSLFINRYLERVKAENLKEKEYTDHVFKNLIDSSIPVTDDEFKQLPELERQVYQLYESLMSRDTFINGEPMDFKVKYFLVPSISIGTYSRKQKTNDMSDIVFEKEKALFDFRPRCNNKKAEKYLYMNKEVAQYYRKYDEYGCLPGIYHSNSTLMSGYMPFIESPPAVKQIAFNNKYNEAYIYYEYQTEGYSCLIKKYGNNWKLLKMLSVITAD